MRLPETHYAKAVDDVHIAYQVLGNGTFDLVVCPGFVTHVECGWEEPRMAAFVNGSHISGMRGIRNSALVATYLS